MDKKDLLNNFFQYKGESFIADYYPKNTDSIIVTFKTYNKRRPHQQAEMGWNINFLIDKNISIIAIIPKTNNWYRGKDLQDFMESKFFKGLLAKYRRHLFAGTSMGGFGALVFSSIVNDAEVLVFSPQSTICKDIDVRCDEAFKQDWTGNFSDASKLYLNKVFIIYDYFNEIDRKHAARIVGANVTHLHFNYVGHSVMGFMQDANVFNDLITLFLNNNLNTNSFKIIKESRKSSKKYQLKKIDYLIKHGYYDQAIILSDTFEKRYDLADVYRDNAIRLEKEDIKTSLKLMEHAYKIRKGNFIKTKLESYSRIVTDTR